MQNYVISFAQENIQNNTDVEATVKKYLLRLKTNVAELNRKFSGQYESCKDNIELMESECTTPVSSLQTELKYSNKYMKSLHDIDSTLDKTIVSFHQTSISSAMKTVEQLCQKTSIVNVFNRVAKELSSHFNLLTEEKISEQAKNVDVKNDKQLTSFLQKVMVRMEDHHGEKSNENVEQKKEREHKEKLVKERSEFAQILYNKAVTYMNNAVQRKKEFGKIETELLIKIKANDGTITSESDNLDKMRKANADLIVSLNRDNDATRGNIKRCQVLTNISIKCKDMSSIYQSILDSYDGQAKALDQVFALLKN